MFENEKQVISKAQEYLNSDTLEVPADAYKSLLDQYRKLFKTTQKLISISDRFDEQLKEANSRIQRQQNELERQNEILKENIKLRENVERITRHDLKTPLSPIINYPKLIARDNLTEKQIGMLEKISASGYKLLKMINLTLDLYKMEQGTYQLTPEPVNMVSILKDLLQELKSYTEAHKNAFDIRINGVSFLETTHFEVQGEALLIYSVLANLLKNALEASPEHATISIHMHDTPEPTITIQNQGMVPEEIQETFFHKYITSGKPGGIGLGTYSAKLMVEAHGGHITMQSSSTEGTTLRIIFPKNRP